jgi:hypothetical protein
MLRPARCADVVAPGRIALVRIVLTMAVAVAGLAVVAPAAANSSSSTSGHVALGTGTFGPACTSGGTEFCDDRSFSFHLAAVSTSSGLPAFGYFDRTNLANGNRFAGVVTCLAVVGNKTAVGGFLTTPSSSPATPFLVYVTDTGAGGSGDGISPFEIFGAGEPLPTPGFPLACPSPQSPLGYFTLASGDTFVH